MARVRIGKCPNRKVSKSESVRIYDTFLINYTVDLNQWWMCDINVMLFLNSNSEFIITLYRQHKIHTNSLVILPCHPWILTFSVLKQLWQTWSNSADIFSEFELHFQVRAFLCYYVTSKFWHFFIHIDTVDLEVGLVQSLVNNKTISL